MVLRNVVPRQGTETETVENIDTAKKPLRNVVPRQGTETPLASAWVLCYPLRNVVPRQGTEICPSLLLNIHLSVLRNVVPRQGTEMQRICVKNYRN